GLMPNRVGAPQHCEVGFEPQFTEGRTLQPLPQLGGKERWIGAPGHERDALGIVHVLVQDAFHLPTGQLTDESGGDAAAAEGQQLHEQTAIGVLALSAALSTLLPQIRLFHPESSNPGRSWRPARAVASTPTTSAQCRAATRPGASAPAGGRSATRPPG